MSVPKTQKPKGFGPDCEGLLIESPDQPAFEILPGDFPELSRRRFLPKLPDGGIMPPSTVTATDSAVIRGQSDSSSRGREGSAQVKTDQFCSVVHR